MIVQIFFFNLQNSPTFYSEERLVNLARGRVCFVFFLSILLVYGVQYLRSGGLTGAKLSCGEGLCGTCTVLLTRYAILFTRAILIQYLNNAVKSRIHAENVFFLMPTLIFVFTVK